MSIVLANSFKTTYLAQLLELLGSLTIHCYKNDLDPDGFTLLDDFEESTFPGYAPLDLTTWGSPYLNGDYQAETDAGLYVWTVSAVPTPEPLYGYYCTTGGTYLVHSERRADGPVLISAAGQQFTVDVKFLLDRLVL